MNNVNDPARKAAEEIAEKCVSDLCRRVNKEKGGSWPCICDYHKDDCETIVDIAAIIERHLCERRPRHAGSERE